MKSFSEPFIAFDNVTIASPSKKTLISDFTARFYTGNHVLISGPNGKLLFYFKLCLTHDLFYLAVYLTK